MEHLLVEARSGVSSLSFTFLFFVLLQLAMLWSYFIPLKHMKGVV